MKWYGLWRLKNFILRYCGADHFFQSFYSSMKITWIFISPGSPREPGITSVLILTEIQVKSLCFVTMCYVRKKELKKKCACHKTLRLCQPLLTWVPKGTNDKCSKPRCICVCDWVCVCVSEREMWNHSGMLSEPIRKPPPTSEGHWPYHWEPTVSMSSHPTASSQFSLLISSVMSHLLLLSHTLGFYSCEGVIKRLHFEQAKDW